MTTTDLIVAYHYNLKTKNKDLVAELESCQTKEELILKTSLFSVPDNLTITFQGKVLILWSGVWYDDDVPF
jgi:hypothetical protein